MTTISTVYFYNDLKLTDPEVYLDAIGSNLGETCGSIVAKSDTLMAEIMPDELLVLGDTNSFLSVVWYKEPAHSDFSHGSVKPLQG